MISDDDEAKISKSLIKTDTETKNKNIKTENQTKHQSQNKTYKALLIFLLMI